MLFKELPCRILKVSDGCSDGFYSRVRGCLQITCTAVQQRSQGIDLTLSLEYRYVNPIKCDSVLL